ncbi:unnamed protein product [Cylicostephanus goldi]|uniref:Uncharacterized protein n=1 Tax=Cylicostephanus goldi TaxID=71465 RepID=A0A3P6S3E6_CYLGO|nr:unnamed protein product [Cylicostephanus goldi]
MRCAILLFAFAAACVHGQSQSSGYEAAELSQPAPPAPVSADGGDQQAYNTDGGSRGVPPVPSSAGFPPSPPPPPPPSSPAPESYTSSASPAPILETSSAGSGDASVGAVSQ